MATTTPNLGLVKPDYEDLADIAVLNDNSDTIDAAVKAVQDSVSAISLTWRAVDATVNTSSTTAPGGHFNVDVQIAIPEGHVPMGIARLTYADYGVALGGYTTTNVTASSLTVRTYFENLTNSTLPAGKAVNVRMYFAKV